MFFKFFLDVDDDAYDDDEGEAEQGFTEPSIIFNTSILINNGFFMFHMYLYIIYAIYFIICDCLL